MNATDLAFDGIVDSAIEILIDRALTEIATPTNVFAWRGRTRAALHRDVDRRAFELLAADVEHNGAVTVTAKMLADLLDPPAEPVTPSPASSSTLNAYELAERRRRERAADEPEVWLDEETRARCIATARAELVAAKAARAEAEAAAKAALAGEGNPNPSDGGTA